MDSVNQSASHPPAIDHRSPRIQIWALGSPHGDDALGWLVGRQLSVKANCAERVHFARNPWDLLQESLCGSRLILIDACSSGALPGTIHRYENASCVIPTGGQSSHHSSLSYVLQLAWNLGYRWDRLTMFAVELDACAPCSEVSDQARRGADRVVAEIVELVSLWLIEPAA